MSGVYGGVINPGGGGAAGGPFVAQGAQVVSVKDAAYGAFGTAARAVDGAITVGTNSLTTASAPNFLVGMSVIIQGAGTTGTALLATVSANGSGTTVLLSTNALTTVTSGGQVDYGWSDITAVQDAINAVSAAGGGVVWFPEGHYLFPVDSTSNSWPTITPGGYHGLRYAVEVPSNVRVKMAQGAYIRLPFNGNTSQHNCVGFAVEANASHVGVEVNIDGCAVIGNTSSFEHYGCLAIDGIDDLQFFNCRWQNLLGKGLLTQGTTAITRLIVAFCIAKNNAEQMATFVNVMWGSVTHCAVHDNIAWPAQGAEGIILGASSHFVIDDLQCYNQGTAVNMQSGTTVSDIEISRVHTDDSISVTASSATDVNIHDCLIDGTTSQGSAGITIGQSGSAHSRFKIRGNTVLNTTGGGIVVQGYGAGGSATDFVIDGNALTGTSTGMQVGGTNCTHFAITNNILNGCLCNAGIGVTVIANNTIDVSASATLTEALLVGCSDATVTGNYLSSSTATAAYGMSVSGGGNTITANSILFNGGSTGAGIYTTNTIGNVFSANTIYNTVASASYRCIKDTGINNVWTNNTLTSINTGINLVSQVGTGAIFRHNLGYNPLGVETVTVPASGTVIAAAAYDRIFYVTAGSSACTIQITGGGPNVVIPTNAICAIRIPANATFTPSYTNAPTWLVYGE